MIFINMRKTKRQAIEEANIALQKRVLNETKLIKEETLGEYVKRKGLFHGKEYFTNQIGDPITSPEAMKLFAEYLKRGIDLGLKEELEFLQTNPNYYKSEEY